MIAALLSAGVFVAVPLTGRAAIGRLGPAIPAIARPSIWVAGGVAIWSVPLLGSVVLGVYRPDIIGALGWLTSLLLLVRWRRERLRIARLERVDALVLAGLVAAALLTAAFPADPFVTGWDMGTYASHAVYIADHGRLDVPYAWPADEPALGAVLPPGNAFLTQPTITIRFSNLWPVWLAQTWATFGYEGLVRLNVLIALLALLAIYGLARRFVPAVFAGALVVILAFNPAQVWVARQTLSEVPTQLFVWCGLLLLLAYLRSGRRPWGIWAGALLGLTAFLHIDGFVVVPLLIAANAVWNVVARRPPATRDVAYWRPVYAGSLPVFGLAVAYYTVFSRPYLAELSHQLLLVAGAAVAALAVLGLTFVPRIKALAHALIGRRATVGVVLGVLGVLGVYLYFIRPVMPPFVTIDAPGAIYDGLRNYVEDALPNLGRYFTPGIVWVGAIGWAVLFVRSIRRRSGAYLIPLLVVALGFTALYGWNQSVWPNHFWAVRRFVPLIIPALIILAAAGSAWLFHLLSRPGRRLAAALIVPLLVVYTLWVGAPMYVTAEGTGSYDALARFASGVPGDGRVIALDGIYEARDYWMPLYLAFDRPITPIDVASDTGRQEAINLLESASQSRPITIVTAAYDFRMDAVEGTRTNVVSWSSQMMAQTTNPVPRAVIDQTVTLTEIKATGISTVGVPFGGPPQWVAASSGFHPPQLVEGRAMRWTDGDGRVAIPVLGDQTPTKLTISLADTGPNGGPLRISLNGATLFDGVVPPGPWSATFGLSGLPELARGDTATVEITSGTFQGDPVAEGDRETAFGVQVDAVTLSAPTTST